MDHPPYDPQTIEEKWQRRWEATGAYAVADDLPRERCYYVLEMFPYPSGKLHMGHVRNYSIGDAIARYKRMRGFQVLHPMGWDSFGLPAEQAAIERGVHPKGWTYDNIATSREQFKRIGFSFDWRREFATSDPGYAHREQLLFLDLVEQGLVYRKSSLVNWSTGLGTVLANEQVVDGRCWRTGTPVIQKELPQWFLRTTAYAEELLAEIDHLDGWPEAVKIQQRNWIGRSLGAEIDFPLAADQDTRITVFTTRPDTVFGVTFMSLAPEHALVERIVTEEQRAAVEAFRAEVAAVSAEDRVGEASEKKGVFTGAYAVNPVNGHKVPIYLANFVLADYGTGAVMAVPAHDTRDFAFAQKYGIDIVKVIVQDGTDAADALEDAFTGVGTMVNSGAFDGQRSDGAKRAITEWMAAQGCGRSETTWRLRDWGISRQRYWGNPIPYVFNETLGMVPLAPQDLPVTLPDDVVIDGAGNPLEKHGTWRTTANDGSPLTVQTPEGREPAVRETDTMDTFVDSSWYFARYACHDNTREDLGCAAPLDRTRVDHWLPVDLYVGGIEHAVMHLLYARFFQKALCDVGHSSVREPFKRLLCQGMVCMETYSRPPAEGESSRRWYYPTEVAVTRDDKGVITGAVLKEDGRPVEVGRVEKMSKSKRNTVDPDDLIARYGTDAVRLFSLRAAPPEKDLVWDDAGLAGDYRFLRRVWTHVHEQLADLKAAASYDGKVADLAAAADQALLRKVHATAKRATDAMERDFGFNTAIAACMELFNELGSQDAGVRRRAVETVILLLAPMTPHFSAELWTILGNGDDIDAAGWPEYDEAELATAEVEYPVQVMGKVRGRITLPAGLDQAALEAAVREHSEVAKLIEGKTLQKVVAVPGRIVNLVAT